MPPLPVVDSPGLPYPARRLKHSIGVAPASLHKVPPRVRLTIRHANTRRNRLIPNGRRLASLGCSRPREHAVIRDGRRHSILHNSAYLYSRVCVFYKTLSCVGRASISKNPLQNRNSSPTAIGRPEILIRDHLRPEIAIRHGIIAARRIRCLQARCQHNILRTSIFIFSSQHARDALQYQQLTTSGVLMARSRAIDLRRPKRRRQ